MTKTILILAANPLDTQELDLITEYKEIKALKQQYQQGDDYVLDYMPAASAEDLQQQLLRCKPYIVHFCGHGETNGLCFQNNNGKAHFIHRDSLSDFFSLFIGRIQCVILNACYTEQQAKTIAQHVDYVIGMNTSIGDAAAIEFTKGFYRALFNGETISAAYKFGCCAIDLANIPEYQTPVLFEKTSQASTANNHNNDSSIRLESPEGTVPLNSSFYVERLIEQRCCELIERPYALLRIKAAPKMGKSSLRLRILNCAKIKNYQSVALSLRNIVRDGECSLDRLLQWLCVKTAKELGEKITINKSEWEVGILPPQEICDDYFEKFLQQGVLVLALEDVDELFSHKELMEGFFPMLRSWFERKTHPLWGNLRLVITYSRESYIKLNLNQSPFNVGDAIYLHEFNCEQVQFLLQRHSLGWSTSVLNEFMELIGGHPYLTRLGLYKILEHKLAFTDFMRTATTAEGVYQDYLHRCLVNLLNCSKELKAEVKRIMQADSPVKVDDSLTFQLEGMGIVKRNGDKVVPACHLYQCYFLAHLSHD